MKKFIGAVPYLAWVTALIAMLGSLFFQYGMHLNPCVLCWYQRIAIYPLVFIIPVSIIRKDKAIVWYVLPLSIIGAIVSVYHNLFLYKLLPASLAPCVQGVSCTIKLIHWFGFITIPLLSLTAFIIIIASMVVIMKRNPYDQRS